MQCILRAGAHGTYHSMIINSFQSIAMCLSVKMFSRNCNDVHVMWMKYFATNKAIKPYYHTVLDCIFLS